MHFYFRLRALLVTTLLLIAYVSQASSDVVLINIRNEQDTSKELSICALKKPFSTNDTGVRYPFIQIKPKLTVCQKFDNTSIQGAAEFIQLNYMLPCSFDTFAQALQANNPAIVLVGSDGPFRFDKMTTYTSSFVFFPQFMANRLTEFADKYPKSTVMIKEVKDKFDWSLIVIWVVALSSIIIGSFWTRREFIKLLPGNRDVANMSDLDDSDLNGQSLDETFRAKQEAKKKKKEEEDKSMITQNIGVVSIFVLLFIVCAVLLLLYFFYSVVIYFVFFLFAMGAATALYRIGSLVLEYIPYCKCRVPRNNIPYLKDHRFEFRKIPLFLGAVTVSIIWFIFRHENWIWIIQDIMAFALSINALSYYRLETYKSITLLLTVFFIYDIFMVFVTPTFTNGTSIMEAVAFGGRENSQSESGQNWNNLQFTRGPNSDNVNPINRLPVVIIVPHLSANKRLCDYYYEYSYSLLGLGDILIPGISVNYGIIFDYSAGSKIPVYFLANVFGYFLGLMMAFIGLIFMNTAQPALLYLCPVLILTSLTTSLVRREFREFWYGKPIKNKANPKENKSFNENFPLPSSPSAEP